MSYIIARTVPGYIIRADNTVNMNSKWTDNQKRAIFMDLNSKGYFLASDQASALRGNGVFNKGYYGEGFIRLEAHNSCLMWSEKVYCHKMDAETLVKVRTLKSKKLGEFSKYSVKFMGETIKIGCQRIPKDRAVRMAKLILKGSKKRTLIGSTGVDTQRGYDVHMSQDGITAYGTKMCKRVAIRLAKNVLKAYNIKA